MLKRGQITIFIIIGLLVVGLIGGIFFFYNKNYSATYSLGKDSSIEVQEIDSSIESCLRQRSIDAIRIIGLQGGYVKLPIEYISTDLANIAYGYNKGKNTLPSKDIIENEISNFINITLTLCLYKNKFQDLEIKLGNSETKTKIEKDYVIVSSTLPVFVTKNNKTITINRKYSSEIHVKLGDMLKISNEIVNQEIIDPSYIQLTYLAGLDYNTLALPIDENNIVYVITDHSNITKIDGVPYSFLFGNKFK